MELLIALIFFFLGALISFIGMLIFILHAEVKNDKIEEKEDK